MKDVIAEIARIETVVLGELNALHRLRRQIAADAGAAPPAEWVCVAEAAHRLRVSETTAWRYAKKVGADWPERGRRMVNMSILRKLQPPRD